MTDEHATQGEEDLVDVGTASIAHAQAAKAVEPSEGTLDHPAVAAQTLAAILSAPGDARGGMPRARKTARQRA